MHDGKALTATTGTHLQHLSGEPPGMPLGGARLPRGCRRKQPDVGRRRPRDFLASYLVAAYFNALAIPGYPVTTLQLKHMWIEGRTAAGYCPMTGCTGLNAWHRARGSRLSAEDLDALTAPSATPVRELRTPDPTLDEAIPHRRPGRPAVFPAHGDPRRPCSIRRPWKFWS